MFFEGERHDLSKTGGFGRKMPPPPGKPVTFYECHPEDHAPAPSVRADFHAPKLLIMRFHLDDAVAKNNPIQLNFCLAQVIEAYPLTAVIFCGSLLTLVFGVLNMIATCPRWDCSEGGRFGDISRALAGWTE